MRRTGLFLAAVLTIVVVLMLTVPGCSSLGIGGGASSPPTPEIVKPKPSVVSVIANTSGSENSYYAVLDITVRTMAPKAPSW